MIDTSNLATADLVIELASNYGTVLSIRDDITGEGRLADHTRRTRQEASGNLEVLIEEARKRMTALEDIELDLYIDQLIKTSIVVPDWYVYPELQINYWYSELFDQQFLNENPNVRESVLKTIASLQQDSDITKGYRILLLIDAIGFENFPPGFIIERSQSIISFIEVNNPTIYQKIRRLLLRS